MAVKYNADTENVPDGKFISIGNVRVVFFKGIEPSPELLNEIKKVNPSVSGILGNAIFYDFGQQRGTLVTSLRTNISSSPAEIARTIADAVKNNSSTPRLIVISYESSDEKKSVINRMRELGLKEDEVLENLKR